MTAVAFIPARGGSQRIPDKNLQLVGGKSLVRRAIECADAAGLLACVSTDSDAIAEEALACGAAVCMRPASLSGPDAAIEDAVLHWMRRMPFPSTIDVVAILQPTSPLRTPDVVRACVERLGEQWDSACTVTYHAQLGFSGRARPTEHGFEFRRYAPRTWRPRTQDQALAQMVYENGCCYAFKRDVFLRERTRLCGRVAAVPIDRFEAVDIDTQEDLDYARWLAPKLDARRIAAQCAWDAVNEASRDR